MDESGAYPANLATDIPTTKRRDEVRVCASSPWLRSPTTATPNFEIRPAFWQNTALKLLCAVALLEVLAA